MSSSEYLLEPDTYKYSTENPRESTAFTFKISPSSNPDTFATEKVTAFSVTVDCPAIILPSASLKACIVVPLDTINCPPTTLTVSFSNTVVFSVPRILMFSNSAEPFPAVSILQPLRLVAKLDDSNLPLECMIKPISFSP